MAQRFTQYDELDLPKVAEEVLKQWEAEDTFDKSLELRKDAPPFVFYDGPPSANGLPGIHHVMARAIKDIFCRYQTQKGRRVGRTSQHPDLDPVKLALCGRNTLPPCSKGPRGCCGCC